MCEQNKQDSHPHPDVSESSETRIAIIPDLERELQLARLRLDLATVEANAVYNASAAGQLQRQFETYQRIAKPLSESKFVPEAYQGNMADCVVAVEIAARIGAFPLAVMQNLCIVKGNPTWKSKFLIACVNKCGRYTTLEYRMTIDGIVGEIDYKTWQRGNDGKNHEVYKPFECPGLDNIICVATAIEKKTGKTLESPPVSIRMAIAEGWYTKDGSKWETMPELMLRYRAASFWVSSYAPELTLGFRTEEEARDIIDVEYEEIKPVAAAPGKVIKTVEEVKEKLRNRAAAQKKKSGDGKSRSAKTEMP